MIEMIQGYTDHLPTAMKKKLLYIMGFLLVVKLIIIVRLGA